MDNPSTCGGFLLAFKSPILDVAKRLRERDCRQFLARPVEVARLHVERLCGCTNSVCLDGLDLVE